MKKLIFAIMLCITLNGYSQDNFAYYTAKQLNFLYFDNHDAFLSRAPKGINVEIQYNTVFKTWVIYYEKEDGNLEALKFTYIQDAPNSNTRVQDVFKNTYIIADRIAASQLLFVNFEQPLTDSLHGALEIIGVVPKK